MVQLTKLLFYDFQKAKAEKLMRKLPDVLGKICISILSTRNVI